MTDYIIKRIVATIPVLIGILFVAFVILYLIPGDPALAVAGPRADEATLCQIRTDMGLDKPVFVRFFNYLAKVCTGNLGVSVISKKPVMESIMEKLPYTLGLAGFAMLLSIIIGIIMGIIGAITKGSFIDRLCTFFSVIGISVPVFLSGLLLLYCFAMKLRWFPISGFSTGKIPLSVFILPAFTLGIRSAAFLARIVRSSMIEILNKDFIRTAKAKGLSYSRIIIRHGLVNALIPIITVIGLDLSSYLNGSVIVETIFGLPGIGRFAMDAISQRDYPVVQGVVLMGAMIFIFVNLFIDIIYAQINPKVRDEMMGKHVQ